MDGMTREKHESLQFYNYLCQKIGSEEVVRIRRLALVIHDIGQKRNTITSGSKGEGLDLKGSDLDIMFIDHNIKVYESETEEFVMERNRLQFIMNTDETQPCFTQLYLVTQHQNRKLVFHDSLGLLNMLEMNNLRYVLPSEQYKQFCMSKYFYCYLPTQVHGPCISTEGNENDAVWCLKCDAWIYQAKPWVRRPRTAWPSPELISKIISCGINCFASSETLQDYQNPSNESTESFIRKNCRFSQQIIPTFYTIHTMLTPDRFLRLLYNFLHSSRTGICRVLFALKISNASMNVPEGKQYPNSSENKHHYFRYKHDLSHLVIGLHFDAMSGLMKLASFFYVHKNYEASLTMIIHTLQKCTDEKIHVLFFDYKKTFDPIQKHVLNLMKNEKLHTIMKSLIIHPCRFEVNSSTIPQELQPDNSRIPSSFHTLPFAHFLNFLCYYHLHDISSCKQSLQRLNQDKCTPSEDGSILFELESLNTIIFCGICYQLMGETNVAKIYFRAAAKVDIHSLTTAASRLSSLNS
ncbi:unnamed protein product [Mytilus coruscus]|uniref:Mab-21-like HhH/H2TH-like domain-containing protein n=1 Tax=Mytilus coruscus TaxID=42192 RepID=A0A6J8AR72_MYTCO|nr:unnamed protein product [Mytilus coruscus]